MSAAPWSGGRGRADSAGRLRRAPRRHTAARPRAHATDHTVVPICRRAVIKISAAERERENSLPTLHLAAARLKTLSSAGGLGADDRTKDASAIIMITQRGHPGLQGRGQGGSVAEWLACWTQAQKGRVQIAAATLSGNCSHPLCHCSPSSKNGSSPLKGCEGNCRPGGK